MSGASQVKPDLKIGDAFRRWRKSAGLTQQQAADMAGISSRMWRKYESGAASPNTDRLRALSALGVRIDITRSRVSLATGKPHYRLHADGRADLVGFRCVI